MGTWQDYVSVLLVVVAVNIQVSVGNQAGRHTYVVRYKHGESLIPVTVVLDYKRQTEYVINMNSRTPAKSVTLYDFKERVIAYKDLRNGECFIGRLSHETIHEENAILKRLKSPVESTPLILTLEPDRPSLTPTEVRNMAGHKAAVFCRRMNTWTLKPERENRRERRDTLNPIDISSVRHDEHPKSKHSRQQRSEVFKVHHDNAHRNRTDRDFSNLQNNRSVSLPHSIVDDTEVSSLQSSVFDASNQPQNFNNVFPFILPRRRSAAQKADERRGSKQNFSVHNAIKTVDDNLPHFSFAHGRSNSQLLSEFPPSLLPSGLGNATALISSTKHTFIPLKTNRPIIIPTISFPSKFSESNLHYGVGQTNPPGAFPGGHEQNTNNFRTLHNRGETVSNYPLFHQLPPEAFILPLTRSSTATTAPFAINNRLGYELLHPDRPSVHNNTNVQTGIDMSPNESGDSLKSVLVARSDQSILGSRSPSTNASENHDVFENTADVPIPLQNHTIRKEKKAIPPLENNLNHQADKKSFHVDSHISQAHSLSRQKSPGEKAKVYGYGEERNTSSSTHFGDVSSPSVDRGDLPIHVPRWYPEITKQIRIPLEIEVLHHQEEYAPDISNRTEDVLSVRSHEIEDHSLRSLSTVISIPIPVETHSNGIGLEKEVKLLPQLSSIPDEEGPSKDTLEQVLGRQDKKVQSKFKPGDFSYPIFSDISNTTLRQVFQRTNLTPGTPLTNGTEIRSFSTDPVDRRLNQVPRPTASNSRTVDESRWTPKRQHDISEGTIPVQDYKIDEGVPSYRKRFPPVTQLFTSDETVAEVGRIPDGHFRLNQQNSQRRRRPSALRNKTHSIPPPRHESWRKHDQGSGGLIDRQQKGLNDQGITFHHRGYPKAGAPVFPYDHHRKRYGILPPGVSVHPRHPQAPYADLADGAIGKTIPVNNLLHSRPRRIHLRHQRRHQRKRNRISPSVDSDLPATNCCGGGDGLNCCSNRRRGRHFSKTGCCSQSRESRRPNLVLPPEKDENEISFRKQVEDLEEDRCMKEKMCRTVYQSTKKVFVCRNIEVDGC